jgi:hypothetical protein
MHVASFEISSRISVSANLLQRVIKEKNIIIFRCVENYKVQTKLGDLALL